MARELTIHCDCGCGATRASNAPRPKTWWLLEDQGDVMRSGPLDFASLACLRRWVTDPRVTENPLYTPDFGEATR